MNTKQRCVLIGAAIIAVAMLVYPPFYEDVAVGTVRATFMKYQFLFGPYLKGRVDFWLLLAQWIATGIVGAIVYMLLADKK